MPAISRPLAGRILRQGKRKIPPSEAEIKWILSFQFPRKVNPRIITNLKFRHSQKLKIQAIIANEVQVKGLDKVFHLYQVLIVPHLHTIWKKRRIASSLALNSEGLNNSTNSCNRKTKYSPKKTNSCVSINTKMHLKCSKKALAIFMPNVISLMNSCTIKTRNSRKSIKSANV